MAKSIIEVVKLAIMPKTTEERVLLHMESGIKQFLTKEDFMNMLDNSALGFKSLQLEEGIFLAKGAVLTATFLDKVKGQEYVADAKSRIVTDGAFEDTEVIRAGKKVKLAAGEKAKEGDICYVYVDGIRIDRTAPFALEPTDARRRALKADRRDAERELQAMKEELGVL